MMNVVPLLVESVIFLCMATLVQSLSYVIDHPANRVVHGRFHYPQEFARPFELIQPKYSIQPSTCQSSGMSGMSGMHLTNRFAVQPLFLPPVIDEVDAVYGETQLAQGQHVGQNEEMGMTMGGFRSKGRERPSDAKADRLGLIDVIEVDEQPSNEFKRKHRGAAIHSSRRALDLESLGSNIDHNLYKLGDLGKQLGIDSSSFRSFRPFPPRPGPYRPGPPGYRVLRLLDPAHQLDLFDDIDKLGQHDNRPEKSPKFILSALNPVDTIDSSHNKANNAFRRFYGIQVR